MLSDWNFCFRVKSHCRWISSSCGASNSFSKSVVNSDDRISNSSESFRKSTKRWPNSLSSVTADIILVYFSVDIIGCAIVASVAKCVVIFWLSWQENSFSFTLNGFTVAYISWAKLPFPWSLVFSSVFPLGGFSSANQQFIGTRANNFWQYGTHCFRKFKN